MVALYWIHILGRKSRLESELRRREIKKRKKIWIDILFRILTLLNIWCVFRYVDHLVEEGGDANRHLKNTFLQRVDSVRRSARSLQLTCHYQKFSHSDKRQFPCLQLGIRGKQHVLFALLGRRLIVNSRRQNSPLFLFRSLFHQSYCLFDEEKN